MEFIPSEPETMLSDLEEPTPPELFSDLEFLEMLGEENNKIVNNPEAQSYWTIKLLDLGCWAWSVTQAVSNVVVFRAGHTLPTRLIGMLNSTVSPTKNIDGSNRNIIIKDAVVKVVDVTEYIDLGPGNAITGTYEYNLTQHINWYFQKYSDQSVTTFKEYLRRFITVYPNTYKMFLFVTYYHNGDKREIKMYADMELGVYFLESGSQITEEHSFVFDTISFPAIEDHEFYKSPLSPLLSKYNIRDIRDLF